ncbi:MAG TPA: hypothetical protein VF712_20005 [Thermoleophilaceae bacterium]
MTARLRTQLVLLAAAALAAVPAGASAHGSPHPAIEGPDDLGAVVPVKFRFDLPGVTLDCPPPETAAPCKVDVAVRTARRIRYRAGQPKRKHVIGRLSYTLASNREEAEPPPVKLNTVGRQLLARLGSLKAVAKFNVFQYETILHDFKLTLKRQ